jgi:hypothetical protein
MLMTREEFKLKAREVPIFGGLVDCRGRDHWDALGQSFVLFVLSSMPIWLGTLIVYAMGDKVGCLGFKLALLSTFSRGELFMYATASLAPIFWIALTEPPGAREFPGKVSHIVLMVIISVIAAVFFGLLTAGNRLNMRFTFDLSVLMFLGSVVLLYLGILYHESQIRDAAPIMKKQEEDFSAEYREHNK